MTFVKLITQYKTTCHFLFLNWPYQCQHGVHPTPATQKSHRDDDQQDGTAYHQDQQEAWHPRDQIAVRVKVLSTQTSRVDGLV